MPARTKPRSPDVNGHQISLFPSAEARPLRQAAPERRGIEERFDVPLVASLALREKQIQQNYRPVIAVHKWFARRPGSLFRALLLSEFGNSPLRESYFEANDLSGLSVADPFMGGGTPLLEANRLGCDVAGWDINPMAYWVVRQEIEHLDLGDYRREADAIGSWLEGHLGHLYRSCCELCGDEGASIKYALWVKTRPCAACSRTIDLFPGYLVAEAGRHPKDVLVCRACGELTEVDDARDPGPCRACGETLRIEGPARRNRCACPACGHENLYPDVAKGPPAHRLFAIEYHCQACRKRHTGRYFKKPDGRDLALYAEAVERWHELEPRFVPDDSIPAGDETDRLHRWGYGAYREMFNERQLLGLESICRRIAETEDRRLRAALATNLSDLLRYQNMLCRYDTRALKSLDVFSVHGFPVGLVQCESNLLGIKAGAGANVGSGGWSNIVEKFTRAKDYCDRPFEVRYVNGRKVVVPVPGEWIGERRSAGAPRERGVDLQCGSSTTAVLPAGRLDAVLTDPPYFANVQYAELMDFCYVWLRRLVGRDEPCFAAASTRSPDELTGNATMARDLGHFTAGLSEVFGRLACALKPGAPFAFTYHHNRIEAYFPVAVAMLDAGLACTASLPCPAEMGGSIHIHGTGSSIVDTVFVCRTTGSVRRELLVDDHEEVARLVHEDLQRLAEGEVRLTRGDARCVAYGHLVRLAVWRLRPFWNRALSWAEKLERVAQAVARRGGWEVIEPLLLATADGFALRIDSVREPPASVWGEQDGEVPF